jgi:signal transduction histidine kinase
VRFIQRSADALSELVNDLLDLAKVEAGKIVVRPAEFRVEDLFSALRGIFRPLLAKNNSVELTFEEPGQAASSGRPRTIARPGAHASADGLGHRDASPRQRRTVAASQRRSEDRRLRGP